MILRVCEYPGVRGADLKTGVYNIPVWQFLNRDYSMNNAFVADAYNEEGLPTAIPYIDLHTLPSFGPFDFIVVGTPYDIEYACKYDGKMYYSGH